jgi:hypothetical protein
VKLIVKRIIIFSIISLVVVFCLIAVNGSTSISYDKSAVIDNQIAYRTLSCVFIDDYIKHDSNTTYTYSNGGRKDGECFIKCYTGEYIFSIEPELAALIKVIKDTYSVDEQCWEYVRVNENFVAFGNVNGRASIIYSANDKKPSFVDDPNDIDKHIYVERIADNLYFAAKR